MKGAIASVELFVRRADANPVRRLTLTLAAPERATTGEGWTCRVALADLHRPVTLSAPDSMSALAAAVAKAVDWVTELETDGTTITRDREGTQRFEW